LLVACGGGGGKSSAGEATPSFVGGDLSTCPSTDQSPEGKMTNNADDYRCLVGEYRGTVFQSTGACVFTVAANGDTSYNVGGVTLNVSNDAQQYSVLENLTTTTKISFAVSNTSGAVAFSADSNNDYAIVAGIRLVNGAEVSMPTCLLPWQ
jgi:hypothetical protein